MIPEQAQAQALPYIPETITVHLGTPESDAPNVTVSFTDYIKNVASSELYPTWPDNALRANIYAIITFALNRVYTEWYRSKGYNFDITNTTQYDQAFVNNREIFENISEIVDEIFTDYVVRQGSVAPFFTAFCNGTTSTCDGLSQWGTVELANEGLTPYEILQYYYGDDINIVQDAPISPNHPSFPGVNLSVGSIGTDVRQIQVRLNRISRDFPLIPKIYPVDGIYADSTANAVRTFQNIFYLPETGVVDRATWYKIGNIYTSVKKLSELNSEALSITEAAAPFEPTSKPGDEGENIRTLQYYLAVIGQFYKEVPQISITGYYDTPTEDAVRSFQKIYGLPETGIIDIATWNDMYRAYIGIIESVPFLNPDEGVPLFPAGFVLREGMQSDYVSLLQQYLTYISETIPEIPPVSNTGYFGPKTKESVMAFQKFAGINPTGQLTSLTWNRLASVYSDLRFGYDKTPGQYPGYVIEEDL